MGIVSNSLNDLQTLIKFLSSPESQTTPVAMAGDATVSYFRLGKSEAWRSHTEAMVIPAMIKGMSLGISL